MFMTETGASRVRICSSVFTPVSISRSCVSSIAIATSRARSMTATQRWALSFHGTFRSACAMADHGKNFIRTVRIQFLAKSFILQVYDVLARHNPKPRRVEWQTKIVPPLQKIQLSAFERDGGLSRRMFIDARTGRRRPHLKNQELLTEIGRLRVRQLRVL